VIVPSSFEDNWASRFCKGLSRISGVGKCLPVPSRLAIAVRASLNIGQSLAGQTQFGGRTAGTNAWAVSNLPVKVGTRIPDIFGVNSLMSINFTLSHFSEIINEIFHLKLDE
jgi:hypothetical protein